MKHTRIHRPNVMISGLSDGAAEAIAHEAIEKQCCLSQSQAEKLFRRAVKGEELKMIMPLINGIERFSEYHVRLRTTKGEIDFWPSYGNWKETAKKGKSKCSSELVGFLLGDAPYGCKPVDIQHDDLEDFQDFVIKEGGEVQAPKQGELVRFKDKYGRDAVIYSSKRGRVGRGSKLAHSMAYGFKLFGGAKP